MRSTHMQRSILSQPGLHLPSAPLLLSDLQPGPHYVFLDKNPPHDPTTGFPSPPAGRGASRGEGSMGPLDDKEIKGRELN